VLHRLCSRADSMLLLVKNTTPLREANSSHARSRRVSGVRIDTVQEK
jgi:hypothetical protein